MEPASAAAVVPGPCRPQDLRLRKLGVVAGLAIGHAAQFAACVLCWASFHVHQWIAGTGGPVEWMALATLVGTALVQAAAILVLARRGYRAVALGIGLSMIGAFVAILGLIVLFILSFRGM